MISDISGVTAEFLFTEKPIVMPAWKDLAAIGKDDTRLAEEYPYAYRWHPETEGLLGFSTGCRPMTRCAPSEPPRLGRCSADTARSTRPCARSTWPSRRSAGARPGCPCAGSYEAKRFVSRLGFRRPRPRVAPKTTAG